MSKFHTYIFVGSKGRSEASSRPKSRCSLARTDSLCSQPANNDEPFLGVNNAVAVNVGAQKVEHQHEQDDVAVPSAPTLDRNQDEIIVAESVERVVAEAPEPTNDATTGMYFHSQLNSPSYRY